MKLIITLAFGALLVGCAQNEQEVRHYGNDALPSAEVTAFEALHARLKYQNARIEYDNRECAVYQGVAADGQVRSVPLEDASGNPLCGRP